LAHTGAVAAVRAGSLVRARKACSHQRIRNTMKGGGHMSKATPGLSAGCERHGVFEYSPTRGGAGGHKSVPHRDLLVQNETFVHDGPP
jgi:hypothetical protein